MLTVKALSHNIANYFPSSIADSRDALCPMAAESLCVVTYDDHDETFEVGSFAGCAASTDKPHL